jgi:hypothetical protein
MLELIRRDEKEKQSKTSNELNYLGKKANWKNVSKSKMLNKYQASKQNLSITTETNNDNMSFKNDFKQIENINNDSEISFGQSQVKIPELCNMLNTYQSEISSNKIDNKDTIEFRKLSEQMFNLINKKEKTEERPEINQSQEPPSPAEIGQQFDTKKIGTPNFRNSRSYFSYKAGDFQDDMLKNQSQSGDFTNNPFLKSGMSKNIDSDKGSILDAIINNEHDKFNN